MATAQELMDANNLRMAAQPIIEAFDDAAEPRGRQLAYVALIKLMETFVATSSLDPEFLVKDFSDRVLAGVRAEKLTRQ